MVTASEFIGKIYPVNQTLHFSLRKKLFLFMGVFGINIETPNVKFPILQNHVLTIGYLNYNAMLNGIRSIRKN